MFSICSISSPIMMFVFVPSTTLTCVGSSSRYILCCTTYLENIKNIKTFHLSGIKKQRFTSGICTYSSKQTNNNKITIKKFINNPKVLRKCPGTSNKGLIPLSPRRSSHCTLNNGGQPQGLNKKVLAVKVARLRNGLHL